MVVMLRRCCCGCCTLKTGTIILGVLNAIGGFGSLLYGIVISAGVGSASNEQKDANFTSGAVVAVFGAIALLFAICLIVGAVKLLGYKVRGTANVDFLYELKSNAVLLLAWMVYSVLFSTVDMVLNIARTAQLFGAGRDPEGTGCIIGTVIYILLETYFILVVYSLYRELKGTAPPTFA